MFPELPSYMRKQAETLRRIRSHQPPASSDYAYWQTQRIAAGRPPNFPASAEIIAESEWIKQWHIENPLDLSDLE